MSEKELSAAVLEDLFAYVRKHGLVLSHEPDAVTALQARVIELEDRMRALETHHEPPVLPTFKVDLVRSPLGE